MSTHRQECERGGARVLGHREKKGRILASLLVLLILATGCGAVGDDSLATDPVSAETGEVILGAEENGDTVEVDVGQALVITLESNPSTGYRWEIVESDEAMLQQVGEVEFEVSDSRDPPPPGAGGTETFRFEVKDVGEMALELVYHRPWEEGVEPVETFSVTVIAD